MIFDGIETDEVKKRANEEARYKLSDSDWVIASW